VIDDQDIERDTEGILKDMVLGKCALTPLGGEGDKMGGRGFNHVLFAFLNTATN